MNFGSTRTEVLWLLFCGACCVSDSLSQSAGTGACFELGVCGVCSIWIVKYDLLWGIVLKEVCINMRMDNNIGITSHFG